MDSSTFILDKMFSKYIWDIYVSNFVIEKYNETAN